MRSKSDRIRAAGKGMLLLILAFSTACSNHKVAQVDSYAQANVGNIVQLSKQTDHWPTQNWNTSTPEEQGISSQKLGQIIQQFNGTNLHSALVIRHGSIVAEAYNSAVGADTPQDILSTTKSITSALTGIAIQDKKLKGTDQKLGDFFPQLKADPAKSALTLSNLLTMTSGLKWDNEGERSSNEMVDSDDWVKYVLDQPITGKVGKDFNYSNGNAHVMSAILQKATGMPTSKYAELKLFEPLGIKNVEWYQDPQNIDIGAFSVHMTARDLAKLGLLYLNNGSWEGKQVIPSQWIQNTIKKYTESEFADGSHGGYGYFWWVKKLDLEGEKKSYNMFYAAGSGGQRIYVLPDLDMVVVFTANTSESFVTEKFLGQIVQAVQSDKPLSPNPDGVNTLQAAVQAFKNVQDRE